MDRITPDGKTTYNLGGLIMSGGSLDYLYYKIEDAARKIPDREIAAMTIDYAKLMHDIEWYIDDDICKNTLDKSLHAFKKKWFGPRDEHLKELIDDAIHQLKQELYDMIEVKE